MLARIADGQLPAQSHRCLGRRTSGRPGHLRVPVRHAFIEIERQHRGLVHFVWDCLFSARFHEPVHSLPGEIRLAFSCSCSASLTWRLRCSSVSLAESHFSLAVAAVPQRSTRSRADLGILLLFPFYCRLVRRHRGNLSVHRKPPHGVSGPLRVCRGKLFCWLPRVAKERGSGSWPLPF